MWVFACVGLCVCLCCVCVAGVRVCACFVWLVVWLCGWLCVCLRSVYMNGGVCCLCVLCVLIVCLTRVASVRVLFGCLHCVCG